MDLLYKIDEGEPYLLGELEIEGNARTRDKVIRREAVQAGLLPGEILDKNRIEIYQAAADDCWDTFRTAREPRRARSRSGSRSRRRTAARTSRTAT